MTDTAFNTLISILTKTQENEKMQKILWAFLTDKEQAELANRLKIFALLAQNVPQRDIASRLGVGVATVSRGAKAFRDNSVGDLLPILATLEIE